ncbi:MAG: YggT family protein [Candidatus Dormibacteraeota bacterium]|nr:YggT family protein [Candidatus Dormibacteraeota bacterium]MBV9525855.1 YggT family protein [Candidatus Dormibacteraeota bacterium]
MNLALTLADVVNFVAGALYVLIFVRILLSWLPISPWNPLVRVLRRIADPILLPFRRVLPTLAGIDFSPIVAVVVILLISTILDQILLAIAVGGSVNIPAVIVSAIAYLLERILIILGVLVLIRLLMTLFGADPWHPLVAGVRSMTNPLVRPFSGFGHRVVHRGLDVPALVTLIAYAVLYVVVAFVVGNLLLHVF